MARALQGRRIRMARSSLVDAGKAVLDRVPGAKRLALRALSIQRSIEGPRRLRREVPRARPLRIAVGAESRVEPGWIATEHAYHDIADRRDWDRFFAKESIDAILAEHVFEHLRPDRAASAARLCHEFLKPGGLLRAAVPDGLHPDPAYIEWVDVGGVGPGAWDHQVLYRYDTFRDVFAAAGFEVRLLEHWDERRVLHQADWDPDEGRIRRSIRFDTKDRGGFRYSSIIVDARKPL
jgi:predicted SAM-dependent methyltransferase